MVKAKRPTLRERFQHKKCCSIILKNVERALLHEQKAGKLVFRIDAASKRAIHYSGLPKSTYYRVLKLLDAPEVERKPRSRKMSLDDEAKIRPVIVDLVKRKITPTLSKITDELNRIHPSVSWKRTSVYNALPRIGFSYTRSYHNYYDRLRENPDNILLRAKYLKRHAAYVKEGRPIIYMDESWINKNARPSKAWSDGTPESVDAVPPGKGARWILIGAGGRNGWIKDTFCMWKGNVKSEDYHTEMNGDVFYDWLTKRLLPNLPSNAVLVLDRATYHMEVTEESKRPSFNLTKAELLTYYLRNNRRRSNTLFNTLMSLKKTAIFWLCQTTIPPKKFKIFEWIKEWNALNKTDIKVNFLPIAHPQLNPIELIWSQIKSYVKDNNHDFNMKTIEMLTRQKQAMLNSEAWIKVCDRADEFAKSYEEADETDLPDAAEAVSGSDLEFSSEDSEYDDVLVENNHENYDDE